MCNANTVPISDLALSFTRHHRLSQLVTMNLFAYNYPPRPYGELHFLRRPA